jgi:hypothetical protein
MELLDERHAGLSTNIKGLRLYAPSVPFVAGFRFMDRKVVALRDIWFKNNSGFDDSVDQNVNPWTGCG